MALTKCPECNKIISDSAEECIHCGYFINNKKHSSNVKKVLIEQTDKKWKKIKLISLIMFVLSFFILPYQSYSDNIAFSLSISLLCVLLFFGSIIAYSYAVFKTWWEHK